MVFIVDPLIGFRVYEFIRVVFIVDPLIGFRV